MTKTTTEHFGSTTSRRWAALASGSLVVLLMMLHGLLLWTEIDRSTPTLDEVAHLPAGFTYLDQGTKRMYRHSPPLARWIAALAASGSKPSLVYERSWQFDEPANHWRFAFETIAASSITPETQSRYLRAFQDGRIAIAAWSVLTIPLMFLWGNMWFGQWSGLLAAALWSLSPNIIAHAGLITTDLAATSMGVLAAFLFSRWLDQATWLRLLLAGIALGLAQLVKFSSLWLYLIFGVWLVAHMIACRETRSSVRRLLSGIGGLVAIGVLSLLTIDVGYGFEGVGKPMGQFGFLSQTLTRQRNPSDPAPPATNNITYMRVWETRTNRFHGSLLESVPCPLPYHFVAGFDEQKFEAEGKYPMYLRGEFADPIPPPNEQGRAEAPPARRGWWYYYFYALLVKVPVSTWVLVGLALVASAVWPVTRSLGPLILLAVVPIAAMSFLTDINLGLRYVLPAFPFLFLIAGSMLAGGRPRWLFVVAGLAIAWNGIAIARIHPHELSYFNEIVGGPANGRFHLIDSNIDWGQDLRGLSRWLADHPEWKETVRIAYAGSIPPEFEGIEPYRLAPRDLRYVPDARLLPWENRNDPSSWGPLPGRYAVSVNFERGMRFHTPCPFDRWQEYQGHLGGATLGGSMMIEVPRGSYAYFSKASPVIVPLVGYSILLYDLSKEDANRIRDEIGLPRLPD